MTASSPPLLPPLPHRLRVLVVRHGETHENVAGIIQGQLDTALNSFGHLQAATTARHLSTVRLDRIITSPLKRARQTAEAILAQQPVSSLLRVEQDDRLKEKGFGVLEGKVYAGPARTSGNTTGIEKTDHLLERLAGFWNELVTVPVPAGVFPPSQENPSLKPPRANRHAEEERVVLLVSHGASIAALLKEVLLAGQYLYLPFDIRPSRLGNCSITEIVVPAIFDRSPPSSKSAGHASLKAEWTIRPPHLNVQGCQQLLELRYLGLQLAHLLNQQENNNNNNTPDDDTNLITDRDLPNHIHRLQARLKSSHENLENDGVARSSLERDVLRGPDGQEVVQDLGYGKGVGYFVRWADTTHLLGLIKKESTKEEQILERGGSQSEQVDNVDELVGKK